MMVSCRFIVVLMASYTTATAFVTPSAFSPRRTCAATTLSTASISTTTTTVLFSTTVDSKKDNDKTEVREYFNTEGFDRWNKIYSSSDEVNSVQLDIRVGHDQTIQKILNWLRADGNLPGKTVCDCGCGVGSLAIPLAQLGAKVSASDISDAMATEAARRAKEMEVNAEFYTSDLESVTGSYDIVTCVDVAIHYPDEKMTEMIRHLCSLSKERVLLSFAPKTWYYVLLKKVGEMFPGPSKTTRAYLHEEEGVRAALQQAGFHVTREEMTATNFYFSRLLEATRTTRAASA